MFRTFLEQIEESIRFSIMLFSSSFYFDFLSQVFKADRSFTSQILNCFQKFEAIVNTPNFFFVGQFVLKYQQTTGIFFSFSCVIFKTVDKGYSQ